MLSLAGSVSLCSEMVPGAEVGGRRGSWVRDPPLSAPPPSPRVLPLGCPLLTQKPDTAPAGWWPGGHQLEGTLWQ